MEVRSRKGGRVTGRVERVGCGGKALEVLAVVRVCLCVVSIGQMSWTLRETYEWHAAVATGVDRGLVCVDEDTRVSKRSSATVARHDLLLGPAHRLLVNELDGCHRSRLCHCQPMFPLFPLLKSIQFPGVFSSFIFQHIPGLP